MTMNTGNNAADNELNAWIETRSLNTLMVLQKLLPLIISLAEIRGRAWTTPFSGIGNFKIAELDLAKHNIQELDAVGLLRSIGELTDNSLLDEDESVVMTSAHEIEKLKSIYENVGLKIANSENNERGAKTVTYDPLTGIIAWKNTHHKFSLGKSSKKPRYLLFKLLWDLKRIEKKTGVVAGESLQRGQCAVKIGISRSAQDFAKDKNAQDVLSQTIKGMNRIFLKKKFPLEIVSSDTIQLVIKV